MFKKILISFSLFMILFCGTAFAEDAGKGEYFIFLNKTDNLKYKFELADSSYIDTFNGTLCLKGQGFVFKDGVWVSYLFPSDNNSKRIIDVSSKNNYLIECSNQYIINYWTSKGSASPNLVPLPPILEEVKIQGAVKTIIPDFLRQLGICLPIGVGILSVMLLVYITPRLINYFR